VSQSVLRGIVLVLREQYNIMDETAMENLLVSPSLITRHYTRSNCQLFYAPESRTFTRRSLVHSGKTQQWNSYHCVALYATLHYECT